MLEQPRKRKKNVVEGGSLGKRQEEPNRSPVNPQERWARNGSKVTATTKTVNRTESPISRWDRNPGEVKATTTARRNTIEDKPTSREIKMYDRAFGETAADRTATHADEKKRAEARAREEAIRRAQQAARGRR